MLLTKEVETKLNGKKIKHYKELGYELPLHKTKDGMCVPRGSVLIVKIEDIPLDSHELVMVSCDYCGKEYKTRYDGYNKRKQNDIDLDCCEECKPIKNKALNILRYGVENQFQREDIKEKLPQIMLDKYGYSHAMKVPEIKERAMKNMSDNNGVACSRPQKYLHQLFGGKLNYVDSSTNRFALDIAFPESKIFIEYDGSGHALQVVFKNMTQKEFNNREIVRNEILKKNGWKKITINSPYDYLPSDEILLEELNKALDWFKSDEKGHSHYNINIGKPKTDITYGKLRKIKETDLLKESS